MVPWWEVMSGNIGETGESMVQTLICAVCLTSNLNAAFPVKLVTFSRSGAGVKNRMQKVILDIPPGLDGYPYFLEGTWPGNSVRLSDGYEYNPLGQTYVNNKLVCAYHAEMEMKGG